MAESTLVLPASTTQTEGTLRPSLYIVARICSTRPNLFGEIVRETSLGFVIKVKRLNETRTLYSFSIHVQNIFKNRIKKIFYMALERPDMDYHFSVVAADYGAMANR